MKLTSHIVLQETGHIIIALTVSYLFTQQLTLALMITGVEVLLSGLWHYVLEQFDH